MRLFCTQGSFRFSVANELLESILGIVVFSFPYAPFDKRRNENSSDFLIFVALKEKYDNRNAVVCDGQNSCFNFNVAIVLINNISSMWIKRLNRI